MRLKQPKLTTKRKIFEASTIHHAVIWYAKIYNPLFEFMYTQHITQCSPKPKPQIKHITHVSVYAERDHKYNLIRKLCRVIFDCHRQLW